MPHRSTFARACVIGRLIDPEDAARFHTVPRFLAAPIVCLVACLAVAGSLHAATITVYSSADAGGTCPGADCTLRQAISTAAAGDTIEVAAFNPIDLTSSELVVDKRLTIQGFGPGFTIVRRSTAPGTPDFRVFHIAPGVANTKIANLAIANGNALGGGFLVDSNSTLALQGVALTGNRAFTHGGGLYAANGANIAIVDSFISGNHAGNPAQQSGGGGIAISVSGTLTIVNSTLAGNSVEGFGNYGGALYVEDATATIVNSTIAGNTASIGGGVVKVGGVVNVRNTIIAKNTATTANPDFSGTLSSQGFNLVGNTTGTTIIGTTTGNLLDVDPLLGPLADNGGLTPTMALLSGSPAIEAGHSSGYKYDQRHYARPVDSPAIANASGGDGADIGAYEVQADVLPGCGNTLVTNNADSGPGSLRSAIALNCGGEIIEFAPGVVSPVTLTSDGLLINKSLTISAQRPMTVQRSAAGGTPYFNIFGIVGNVAVNLVGLTIAGGQLEFSDGAGVFVGAGAEVQLVFSTLTSNGANGSGGGLHNTGTTTLYGSTVSGNAAYSCGGGLNNYGGTMIVHNSTIAVNNAFTAGGAVCNQAGGTLEIKSTTIAGNSAGFVGGVLNGNGSTTTLRNTLIAKNTVDYSMPDIQGTLTSQGFNLIGAADGGMLTPAMFSDQVGFLGAEIDPKLGPLQNNGGMTKTMMPAPDSPVIDRGDSSGHGEDQRQFYRPIDVPALPNATGGDGADIGAVEFIDLDVDGNGTYDPLTDGLLVLRYLFGYDVPPLTLNAIGPMPARTDIGIAYYLFLIRSALDVDGNGKVDALTDGVIVIRYLAGERGPGLTNGVLGAGATRTSSDIESYIQSMKR